MRHPRFLWWQQPAAALALAALFTLAWTVRDWTNLSQLRLPDTDDAMRLQQVRDWLAGQGFGDVAQYRLAGGLPLHWSRLADLGPAALIAALAPLLGRHAAEVAAVVVWPGLLFAAALWLTGRIARLQLVSAPTAMLVAALAFPASALFLPGRIDHHGLQLVLLLALVLAMLHARGVASGIGIALAAVAGLVIGLETAPFAALACLLVALGWVADRPGSQRHLVGLGGALLAAGLVAAAVFAPTAFAWPACDGFTRQVWQALLVGAGGLLALAATGPLVAGRGPRLLLALGIGGLTALAAVLVAPACLAPYGAVDAALAQRWLVNVGEAQSPFAAAPATVLGQCGLLAVGLLATAGAAWRTRDPGWAILGLFQATAAAITLWQLRGAAAGALLAAPAFAWAIGRARDRGAPALVAAWLASAGILYPLAAATLPAGRDAAPPACFGSDAIAAFGALPAGTVAGPIDLGAWGIAGTHHRFLAAPYHRNNAGNAAAYAILDGPAGPALATARRWRASYLAACDAQPGWWRAALRPVAAGGGLTIYAIPRLPDPTARP